MSERCVIHEGKTLDLEAGETVLDGLLRHGVPVGHSCRSGHCQACLVRGEPAPPNSQVGLKGPQISKGAFLACQARPTEPVVLLETAGAARRLATVQSKALLAEDVTRLRLSLDAPLDYEPGQFVHVHHPDGALRSYSLASTPEEDFLELHVRRVDGGLVSGWIHSDVEAGDTFDISGPNGACFYVEGEPDQPLILAGAGTGLAPLWGIVREALAKGHRGPVHLIQGAFHASRLYLLEELKALGQNAAQVRVHLCALHGSSGSVSEAPLDVLAAEVAGQLERPRAFLCGDDALVRSMQRRLFLAGVASTDILSDPFIAAAPNSS